MDAPISPKGRRLEKQASRERDIFEISEGHVSAQAIQRRNDMFGAFDPRRASIRVKIRQA